MDAGLLYAIMIHCKAPLTKANCSLYFAIVGMRFIDCILDSVEWVEMSHVLFYFVLVTLEFHVDSCDIFRHIFRLLHWVIA